MTDVRQNILNIIQKVAKPAHPVGQDPDKSLLAGDIDSLDFASVLMALEDEFDIALQDTDVEELNTINKLVAYISKAKS